MRIIIPLCLMMLAGCAVAPTHQAADNKANTPDQGQPCHMPTSSIDGAKYCFNEDAYLRSMTMR